MDICCWSVPPPSRTTPHDTAVMSLTISPPLVDNPPSSLRVIRQIALFEGRRQVKSPLLWLAVLASLVLVWLAVKGSGVQIPSAPLKVPGTERAASLTLGLHARQAPIRRLSAVERLCEISTGSCQGVCNAEG